MNVIITDNPSTSDIEEIKNGLVSYNRQYFDTSSVKPLAIFITTSSGEKIAGISCSTLGNWLSIHFLWVASSDRHTGLGSQLIKTARARSPFTRMQICSGGYLQLSSPSIL